MRRDGRRDGYMNDRSAQMAGDQVAGAAQPHESAHLHVSGEAVYVDDIPELNATLHAALGLSERAHARLLSLIQAHWHQADTIAILLLLLPMAADLVVHAPDIGSALITAFGSATSQMYTVSG